MIKSGIGVFLAMCFLGIAADDLTVQQHKQIAQWRADADNPARSSVGRGYSECNIALMQKGTVETFAELRKLIEECMARYQVKDPASIDARICFTVLHWRNYAKFAPEAYQLALQTRSAFAFQLVRKFGNDAVKKTKEACFRDIGQYLRNSPPNDPRGYLEAVETMVAMRTGVPREELDSTFTSLLPGLELLAKKDAAKWQRVLACVKSLIGA
ncbi:MAG: hypothetical protein PHS41_11480 [Victivallaceae bacterium]|nr:hypothetical protein [Victivallaceae bacterium]